jgi:hypothetical protein
MELIDQAAEIAESLSDDVLTMHPALGPRLQRAYA